MKKNKISFLTALMMVLMTVSCAKLDTPELDNSMTLSSLKAYVYYDSTNLSIYKEVNLLSGKYLPDMGLISYTFPSGSPEIYNETTLKRCRIEASVPSTASVELLDASGNPTGEGLGGFHDLYDQTIYFQVVAADGETTVWQLNCNHPKD